MLSGKSYLSLFRGGGEGDHSIKKEGVTNRNCGRKEKLAWEVEKTRRTGANREFDKR